MTFREHLGVKGDECQCGRRQSVRHCTACGSTRVYARLNRYHTHLNGQLKQVDVQYRCQRCSHLFIEEEREFCDAPPVSTALAVQKIQALRDASRTGEHLNKTDAQIASALTEMSEKTLRSPEEAENDRKILITRLRGVYADMILAEATKLGITFQEAKERGVITESMDDFVNRHLAELSPTVAQASSEDATSADSRAFRLEWAKLKLQGRPVPCPVEEYVERRLKGEVFP